MDILQTIKIAFGVFWIINSLILTMLGIIIGNFSYALVSIRQNQHLK